MLTNMSKEEVAYKDNVRTDFTLLWFVGTSMLEFLCSDVVTVDDDDLTTPSRSIRLCAFDDGVQEGATALHYAAREGHADCVELLLKHMHREGVELKDDVRNLKRSLCLSLFRPRQAQKQQQRSGALFCSTRSRALASIRDVPHNRRRRS